MGDELLGSCDEVCAFSAFVGAGYGSVAGVSSGVNESLASVTKVPSAGGCGLISNAELLTSLDTESDHVDLHASLLNVCLA